jgi:FkbM family methyltransferase
MTSIVGKIKHYGIKQSFSYILGELNVRIVNRLVFGSYSQSKEDLVLDTLLGGKRNGFYVDIGAYDPSWLSNTKRFYLRGWHGINIEPNTENWEKFMIVRARDINLNIGVGPKSGSLTYYAMDPPTLSTFSKRAAEEYERSGSRLLSATKISVMPLSALFLKYCPHMNIDFMSIDVEGFEMGVLKSNNWKKYRPTCLCVESASEDGDVDKTKRIKVSLKKYLAGVGYTLVYDNGLNSFYRDAHHG